MTDSAYARAGVNVDLEAQASRIMFEASKETFANREGKFGPVAMPFEDFAGLRAIDVSGLPPGSFMSFGLDSTGTKNEIAERTETLDTIAFDLFAMVCDDAILRGGEPAYVGSILAIPTLGSKKKNHLPKVRELAKGYVAAAGAAGVAVLNGEIAQIGARIRGFGDFPFDWGAVCIWFARKEKLFTGKEIRAGDAVVVLQEKGFRCNGLSLVRKTFAEKLGDAWHDLPFNGTTLGLAALEPSRIYSRFFVGLHGGLETEGTAEIHGVAHITGGGVPEKLGRVLRPSGVGARLDNLLDPPEIMQYCQTLGGVSDLDAYGTWNMGQGLAIITPEPEQVVAAANGAGIGAQIAGEVTSQPGIRIVSKGVQSKGKEL